MEITYDRLSVAITMPPAGVRPVTLPALARRAGRVATFTDHEVPTDTARQHDADHYQRAALTREGRTGMRLDASEGDAGVGDPGHLRAGAADGALRATSPDIGHARLRSARFWCCKTYCAGWLSRLGEAAIALTVAGAIGPARALTLTDGCGHVLPSGAAEILAGDTPCTVMPGLTVSSSPLPPLARDGLAFLGIPLASPVVESAGFVCERIRETPLAVKGGRLALVCDATEWGRRFIRRVEIRVRWPIPGQKSYQGSFPQTAPSVPCPPRT